jgi:hypothetical protein
MTEDPGVKIGDRVEVLSLKLAGKKCTCIVSEVITIPFGTTLPEGFYDITDGVRDFKKGIRVGVKGQLV